ncbi:hypothetical protein ACNF40_07135 [Cuniculiplasma sp. SKW4]|uniref:hypothetical protein n=1 Tax=Cuniculiplasma sp. SKW4 TaxID=3400171 RepID=UPI003FD1D84E
MEMIEILCIPSFQTLSRSAGTFNVHGINREIKFLCPMESIAAIDSFIIHNCKKENMEELQGHRNVLFLTL